MTTTMHPYLKHKIEERPNVDRRAIDSIPAHILDQLARSDKGELICPIPDCGLTHNTDQAMHVHLTSHMNRALGITALRKPRFNIQATILTCPLCDPATAVRMRYGSIYKHLTDVHEFASRDASLLKLLIAEQLRIEYRNKQQDKLPVEADAVTPPPKKAKRNGHRVEMSPTDAGLAVIMGLGGEGSIKVADLPEVIEFLKATEHVATLIQP